MKPLKFKIFRLFDDTIKEVMISAKCFGVKLIVLYNCITIFIYNCLICPSFINIALVVQE